MREPVNTPAATAGGTEAAGRVAQTKNRQPLAGRPGFIDINQHPRGALLTPIGSTDDNLRRRSTGAYRAGHQAFRRIRYRLKTGGAGAAYTS